MLLISEETSGKKSTVLKIVDRKRRKYGVFTLRWHLICSSGMGNAVSDKKKQQKKAAPQQKEVVYQRDKAFYSKNILLLHKSDAMQLNIVSYFRDAFIGKTEGTIEVTNFVNIADANKIPRSLAWLNKLHSVVLICLTSESIEDFQRIIRNKGFVDQNGYLHPKVFSVTFGESLAADWPPKGLKKGSKDLRDFHFGFSDVEKITPHDFDRSSRMNSLIAAIKGADIKDMFQY